MWNPFRVPALTIDDLAEAAATGTVLDVGGEVAASLLVELLSGTRPLRAVRLRGASITGKLDLDAMTLSCPLSFESCGFDQAVSLAEAQSRSIRLQGCRVPLLVATGLRTSGNLELGDLVTTVCVLLAGAHIGGDLDLRGANLGDTGAGALLADGLTVERTLYGSGLVAAGRVSLIGAQVGAQASFDGAKLSNPDGAALSASRFVVKQDLYFRDGFSATGVVDLNSVEIGGQLVFRDATITNPHETALIGERLAVGGSLAFAEEFRTDGEILLLSAQVGGQLAFQGSSSVPAGETALTLSYLTAGTLMLTPAQQIRGRVDLVHARVRSFYDITESWPAEVGLLGFEYESLSNDTMSVRERLSWLARDHLGYSPAVYDQLAAAYRRIGRVEAARRVSVAKQWRRRRVLNPLAKLWNWLLYLTVGYGYRTWLAGLWLVVLVALGTALFGGALRGDLRASAPAGPAFQPVGYTLDVLVPIIDLGQKKAWYPQGDAQVWSWLFTGAGWVLTTAVVAGVTTALKRE